MATQVQFRGGTTTQTDAFTGAAREVTVDTTKDTLVVHDGTTQGGFTLLREGQTDDATINGLTIGLGLAEVASNTVVGKDALDANTTEIGRAHV